MSGILVLFSLWFLNYNVFGLPVPCQLEDEACTTESFKKILADVMGGVPSLGIDSSDPLVQSKAISAELPKLTYTFTDGQITGFKDCSVLNAKFTNGGSKLLLKLKCPKLTLTAKYELKGEILLLKLDGKGSCKIVTEGSEYTLDINVDKNNDHLKLKDFDFNFDIKEKVTYEFKDLFNGDKTFSDALHKTVNENWKEVAKETHGPGTHKYLEHFIANLNQYFDKVPIQQLFARS